jgi:hypothetical protein
MTDSSEDVDPSFEITPEWNEIESVSFLRTREWNKSTSDRMLHSRYERTEIVRGGWKMEEEDLLRRMGVSSIHDTDLLSKEASYSPKIASRECTTGGKVGAGEGCLEDCLHSGP